MFAAPGVGALDQHGEVRGGFSFGSRAGDQHVSVRSGFSFGSNGEVQGGFSFGAPSLPPPPAIEIPADTRIAEMQSRINNQEFSDVCFVVDGKKVYAHKIILATHSPYFRNMLGSNMRESEGRDIQIQDVSIETFMHVLQYIYTGEVLCDSLKEFQLLLVASDMYQMKRLKAICEHNISQRLTVEDVTSILLLSSCHSADGLKRCAMDFVMSNWKHQVIKESISILEQDPPLMTEVFNYAQENCTLLVTPSSGIPSFGNRA